MNWTTNISGFGILMVKICNYAILIKHYFSNNQININSICSAVIYLPPEYVAYPKALQRRKLPVHPGLA